MAECSRTDEVNDAIIDGSADPSDMAELGLHVQQCAACQATLAELRVVSLALCDTWSETGEIAGGHLSDNDIAVIVSDRLPRRLRRRYEEHLLVCRTCLLAVAHVKSGLAACEAETARQALLQKCPSCGELSLVDDRFCSACGAVLGRRASLLSRSARLGALALQSTCLATFLSYGIVALIRGRECLDVLPGVAGSMARFVGIEAGLLACVGCFGLLAWWLRTRG